MLTFLRDTLVFTFCALCFVLGAFASLIFVKALQGGAPDTVALSAAVMLVTFPVIFWVVDGTPPMIRISRRRNFDTGHCLNTRYRALLLVPVLDGGRLLLPGLVFVTDTASGWGHFDRWLRKRVPQGPRAIRVGD